MRDTRGGYDPACPPSATEGMFDLRWRGLTFCANVATANGISVLTCQRTEIIPCFHFKAMSMNMPGHQFCYSRNGKGVGGITNHMRMMTLDEYSAAAE